MFTVVAATLFSAAFLLAICTMAGMILAYRDKMVAALLFEPIPQRDVIYHIRVSRPRVGLASRRANASFGGVLAA